MITTGPCGTPTRHHRRIAWPDFTLEDFVNLLLVLSGGSKDMRFPLARGYLR